MGSLGWAVLCRSAIIDKRTNQISVVESIEKLAIEVEEDIPATDPVQGIPVEMSLATFWYSLPNDGASEFQIRVALERPDGELIEPPTVRKVALAKGENTRVIMQIPMVPYHGAGCYFWIVEQEQPDGEWNTCARLPFQLVVNVQSKAQ